MAERFRFNLRTMLAATAVIALWSGVFRSWDVMTEGSHIYAYALLIYLLFAIAVGNLWGKVWVFILLGIVPAVVILLIEFLLPLLYSHQ